MSRPGKPPATVVRARRLRRAPSLPEAMLWRHLRGSPAGIRFRRQHPAGPYILDFFCARANLAIEIDGISHELGDRSEHDAARDVWLAGHPVTTLRIAACDVLKDSAGTAETIVAYAVERLRQLGKAPPSDAVASATSPSQADGEELS